MFSAPLPSTPIPRIACLTASTSAPTSPGRINCLNAIIVAAPWLLVHPYPRPLCALRLCGRARRRCRLSRDRQLAETPVPEDVGRPVHNADTGGKCKLARKDIAPEAHAGGICNRVSYHHAQFALVADPVRRLRRLDPPHG